MAKKKSRKTKKKSVKLKPQAKLRLGLLGLVAACILGLLIYIGYLFMNPLQLKSYNITTQYMESYNPKSNISFVFFGSKKNVKVTGDLDTNKIGDYVITYKYKNQKLEVNVKVTDMVAPELTLKNYTADLKQEITPEMLVHSVSDDSAVTLSFEEGTDFSSEGVHTVTVIAEDEYGNQTKANTKVTRKKDTTAPEFSGLSDTLTLWQGNTISADPNISLSDNLDPSPSWTMDTSNVNTSQPGEYEITYTGTDRSGNTTTVSQKVEVLENEEATEKVVYLTFSGGPSAHTAEILNILEKNNAKATFFVSGTNPSFDEWIGEAASLGHTIGLESYCEDISQIYTSSDAYWSDIASLQEKVKELTGSESKILRFLGGSGNTDSATYASGIMSTLTTEALTKGYQYFDWTVDSLDSEGNNIPSSELVENCIGYDDQHITILMHDSESKQTTVDALQRIIDYYSEQGYVFLPLSEKSIATHQQVNN
jgi:peptidoglycan/xylan/chitin deacetylase (PgdA/CDA1 family)